MGKGMISAAMTKDLLMKYTLIALFVITFFSYFAFGLDSLVIALISVGVAVACDLLLSMVMGEKGPRNTMSAIVFGLIVALSYSLGLPTRMMPQFTPALNGGIEQYMMGITDGFVFDLYIYPAVISALGMIVFKKIQGLAGRKYVNPAAIAKLLVLGLLIMPTVSQLIPTDHTNSINLQNPLTADAFGGPAFHPMDTAIFGSTLVNCYGSPDLDPMNPYIYGSIDNPLPDVIYNMLFFKYHGWVGGFSSILVIAVGIALFALSRGYIKWRITLTFLVTTAVMSFVMYFIYGGDPILRLLFHLFMGSSIFMAFFMATDPATTPLTRTGQVIFGIGLGILTMIIQVYTGFLGGSILALVIMNLTCPLLDRIGVPKALDERTYCAKIPKAKKFESVRTTQCIRCGRCLLVCSGRIPTISIVEAADRGDWERVEELGAGYCQQCGTCSYVCPARIDLKGKMLVARDKVGIKPLKKHARGKKQ